MGTERPATCMTTPMSLPMTPPQRVASILALRRLRLTAADVA